MAKNDFYIEQNLGMVLKVNKAENKETSTGKKFVELSCQTPEGAFIKVKNFERNTDIDFVNDGQQNLKNIVEQVKSGKTVYIKKGAYYNKNKSTQFDWLTSSFGEDGRVYYEVSGFVDVLKYKETEDGDIVSYDNYGNDVNRMFSEIDNDIQITMYVKGIEDNRVVFTNNSSEYEKVLAIDVSDTSKVEIGRAYKIRLKFVKGEKIESVVDTTVDWWNTSDNKVSFAPNKLIPTFVKKLDKSIDIVSADNKSNSVENDDEMPF